MRERADFLTKLLEQDKREREEQEDDNGKNDQS